MALVKTWYTVADAAAKFGIKKSALLFWVQEGLVRCERDYGEVVRVNIDDVRMQVADADSEG
jgi:DNA-binding transcriptional MerR regulator